MVKISGEYWERIKRHFPEEGIPEGRAGRKPVPARKILDAVLWILKTGAQWSMFPQLRLNFQVQHLHREFRRYKRRWIVERFFAWMKNKRRLLSRWEFNPKNFLGFVQL